MKLEFTRKALAVAMGIVGSVVPSRTPKPILLNVKLQVRNGQATLIGTDQESSIRFDLPEVAIDDPKAAHDALLPARRITDILRELRDDKVTLHFLKDAVKVVSGRSEFKLPVADPAEFPEVAAFNGKDYYTLPGKTLRELIRRTIFATDPDSSRYALGGILFEFDKEKLSLVTTDSRRLAMVTTRYGTSGTPKDLTNPPVIPSKAMSLVERTIPDTVDDVQIAINAPNDVLFKSGPVTIYSRLLEGRFPRYKDVLPKSHELSIDVVAGQFNSVVRQAQVMTNEESRGVDFTFESGSLTLDSEVSDLGKSKVELPIGYDGVKRTFRFDPRYIVDYLKVLSPETLVTFRLDDDDSPGLFCTDDGYTYVVMPLSRD